MMHAKISITAVLVPATAALLMLACTDSESAAPGPTGGSSAAGSGGAGGQGLTGGGGAAPTSDCELLGLPPRPFEDAADDDALYAVAADLTLPTTEGDYSLKDRWTGCDALLFIQDEPRQDAGSDWPTPLWERDVDDLLESAPKNTRFFFMSVQSEQADIDAALASLGQEVDAALATMTEEDRSWWLGRIHYVTQRARALPGWLGDVMTSPGWGVGIDRFQRIRYIGSYGDPTRWSDDEGWFAPNLSMAANEAIYYNFEAERDARLESQDATVVSVFPGGAGSDGSPTDADLPDATTMAGFDSMELDLTMGCIGDGELGDCPAWDYMAYVYLCPDPGNPDDCSVEVGRWITTYHREGRWVHDVSGLLPLLSEGGSHRFAFQSDNDYEVKLDIRLYNQGKAARPTETTYLFDSFGVPFDENYNDGFEPIEVDIPDDAAKVELATIISGHGMQSPGNCAEFCITTHHFFVNGEENEIELSDAGSQYGCLDKVDRGTVPNQYGTWWYGRSGWCPGWEVPMEITDVTDQVDLGATNTFEYEGYRNGSPYAGSATIRLRSWLVVSK